MYKRATLGGGTSMEPVRIRACVRAFVRWSARFWSGGSKASGLTKMPAGTVRLLEPGGLFPRTSVGTG